jgi:5-methyltetrahydropteroyltriglutamate--homocysteine methyltransferase
MASSASLGFPRIGPDRELKRATEAYWAGRVPAEELLDVARRLRVERWRAQRDAGVEHVPSNDFSLYDHVLDTAVLVGAVPERYLAPADGGRVDGLDVYYAMARGARTPERDVEALGMTKWYDTNYHYIVPEVGPGTRFRLSSTKPLDEYAEALEQGIRTRPVLLGPLSFLLLSRAAERGFHPVALLLDPLVEVYAELLARLGEAGAEWVQVDEPCLVRDRTAEELAALERAYAQLALVPSVKLMVQTYYGAVGDAFPVLARLPVAGVGLDLTAAENLERVTSEGFPADKVLSAGVVDGRNVWVNDLDASLRRLERIADRVDADRLVVSPSCSLLHVPLDVERETGLDPELRGWLSFARQKLEEVAVLTRGVNEGRAAVAAELEANRVRLRSRAASPRTRIPAVRERAAAVEVDRMARPAPFAERKRLQAERLGLPLLPTTVVGSFPQRPELRAARRRFRQGQLPAAEYERLLRREVEHAVRVQEAAGIDVPAHGEAERGDMVEYFAERLDGFAITRHGWVQSFGTRCVKPPILFGDVGRPAPITVGWWCYAQSLTDRPMKAILTGPVTLLQWSFVRDDQSRRDTCVQLALAVRDEVEALERAGAAVIQVDEPALREGLPLRAAGWSEYLRWAVGCFRAATAGARPETQIQTHMCYSRFDGIMDAVEALDADVLLIENARSGEVLLEVFRERGYGRDVGPGVYDIHSPRVPTVREMVSRLSASVSVLPAEAVWVTPDCGLKTRTYDEVEPALRNLVRAARAVREGVAEGETEPSAGTGAGAPAMP